MPVSKAQQNAVTKYTKANYDEIKVRVEKGQKDTIQAHAAAMGESVNAFIGRSIMNQVERDGGGDSIAKCDGSAESPQEAAGAPAVYKSAVSPDTLEAAQRAAHAAREAVPDFIRRAVDNQAMRDSGGPSSMIVLSPELVRDATVGGFAVGETTRQFVMRAVRELVERERPEWDDETLRFQELGKMAVEKGIMFLPPGALESIFDVKKEA